MQNQLEFGTAAAKPHQPPPAQARLQVQLPQPHHTAAPRAPTSCTAGQTLGPARLARLAAAAPAGTRWRHKCEPGIVDGQVADQKLMWQACRANGTTDWDSGAALRFFMGSPSLETSCDVAPHSSAKPPPPPYLEQQECEWEGCLRPCLHIPTARGRRTQDERVSRTLLCVWLPTGISSGNLQQAASPTHSSVPATQTQLPPKQCSIQKMRLTCPSPTSQGPRPPPPLWERRLPPAQRLLRRRRAGPKARPPPPERGSTWVGGQMGVRWQRLGKASGAENAQCSLRQRSGKRAGSCNPLILHLKTSNVAICSSEPPQAVQHV